MYEINWENEFKYSQIKQDDEDDIKSFMQECRKLQMQVDQAVQELNQVEAFHS